MLNSMFRLASTYLDLMLAMGSPTHIAQRMNNHREKCFSSDDHVLEDAVDALGGAAVE